MAGPEFARAVKLPIEDRLCRWVLCLLAGFADAGEHSPPVWVLARRLDVGTVELERLIARLERDGWLRVDHRGEPGGAAVYELCLERRAGR